jgi:glucose-6-phosphate isomerase
MYHNQFSSVRARNSSKSANASNSPSFASKISSVEFQNGQHSYRQNISNNKKLKQIIKNRIFKHFIKPSQKRNDDNKCKASEKLSINKNLLHEVVYKHKRFDFK